MNFTDLELSEKAATQLLVNDSDSWSALTLREATGTYIVLNPTHADTRQRNDLMHEIAHVELRHTPSRVDVSTSGLFLLNEYSEEQELEADWYAATLLLPRGALFHYRKQRKTSLEIANLFGVSVALCEWRLRMTGIDVQLRRGRSSRER